MRWESKNLQQFLDTKTASSDVWSYVHIHPDGTWMATDKYNLGIFDGPEIKGLGTNPLIVEDGKEFLDLIHEHGHHDMTMRYAGHLIIEWWIKTKIESVAVESNENVKTQYEQVKHSASIQTRPRKDTDPKLDAVADFWFNQRKQPLRSVTLEATSARLMASMKEGPQASPKPARRITMSSRKAQNLRATTFEVHNTQGFRGALHLNNLMTEGEQ